MPATATAAVGDRAYDGAVVWRPTPRAATACRSSYVTMPSAPQRSAAGAAANDDALIAPSVTARLLATFARSAPRRPTEGPAESLTDREEEVVRAVARGRTNTEIGAELGISSSTVKSHVSSVMGKLGARNRVELAMWAFESGRHGR